VVLVPSLVLPESVLARKVSVLAGQAETEKWVAQKFYSFDKIDAHRNEAEKWSPGASRKHNNFHGNVGREYKESHSHRALGERTPNEFAKEIAASRDFSGCKPLKTHPKVGTKKSVRSGISYYLHGCATPRLA
jgi:hypothetical protein